MGTTINNYKSVLVVNQLMLSVIACLQEQHSKQLLLADMAPTIINSMDLTASKYCGLKQCSHSIKAVWQVVWLQICRRVQQEALLKLVLPHDKPSA